MQAESGLHFITRDQAVPGHHLNQCDGHSGYYLLQLWWPNSAGHQGVFKSNCRDTFALESPLCEPGLYWKFNSFQCDYCEPALHADIHRHLLHYRRKEAAQSQPPLAELLCSAILRIQEAADSRGEPQHEWRNGLKVWTSADGAHRVISHVIHWYHFIQWRINSFTIWLAESQWCWIL